MYLDDDGNRVTTSSEELTKGLLNKVKPWQLEYGSGDGAGDSLNMKGVLEYARSEGYTGPADRVLEWASGQIHKGGAAASKWTQSSFAPRFQGGELQDALMGELKRRGLQDDFHSGFYNTNEGGWGGDWFPMLMAAGMTMGAASPYLAGGTAAVGAGEVAGTAATGAGEYSLAAGSTGAGLGGGNAGLGAGGVTGTGGATLSSQIPAAGGLPGILSQIPNEVLKSGIQGVLKYLGTKSMGDTYSGISGRAYNDSAWARDRFQQTFTDPKYFNRNYRPILRQIADDSTRAWSTKGNPANNPGIAGNIFNDVFTRGLIPLMTGERSSLGSYGTNGVNASTTAALAGAPYSNPLLSGAGTVLEGVLSKPKDETTLTIGGLPYRY